MIIMNLGYLLILAQKEHRGIHDLLADTSVIYYHEKKVYVHTQMNYRNMVPQPGYTVPPQGNANSQTPQNADSNSMSPQSNANPPMAQEADSMPPQSKADMSTAVSQETAVQQENDPTDF